MIDVRAGRIPSAWVLALGVVLGWTLASLRPPAVHADRGATPGAEDQVTAGPVSIQHEKVNDIQVPHDAIYYLDYKGGRLLAGVPSHRQSTGGMRVLESFAERDLVADFKLTPGTSTPHFLMTTGTLGAMNGAWAPLYVFESTTKQVAVYRVVPLTVGATSRPTFELLEVVSYARPQPQAAAR